MDQSPLEEFVKVGSLRDPVLVVALVRRNGFNSTARAAADAFMSRHESTAIARIDCDQFADFSMAPPTVRFENDTRLLDWPHHEFRLMPPEGSDRDVVILSGVEPQLHWLTFIHEVQAYLERIAVRRVIVLRTWPAQVPHTRPILTRLTTDSDDFARALQIESVRSTYEGPTDFGGALIQELAKVGVDGAGLLCFVPNYLGVVPNPMAMAAIVKILDRLGGTTTDMGDVERRNEELLSQANSAMEKSDELRSAIAAMEEKYEELAAGSRGSESAGLPSSDEIIGDVERFLRGE